MKFLVGPGPKGGEGEQHEETFIISIPAYHCSFTLMTRATALSLDAEDVEVRHHSRPPPASLPLTFEAAPQTPLPQNFHTLQNWLFVGCTPQYMPSPYTAASTTSLPDDRRRHNKGTCTHDLKQPLSRTYYFACNVHESSIIPHLLIPLTHSTQQ